MNEIGFAAALAPGDWLADYTLAGVADARAFIALLGDTYHQPEDSVALGVSRATPGV
jgi:hypothetical protein